MLSFQPAATAYVPTAPDAAAARKMAIVDALPAHRRAIVHEIGLYDFSNKYSRSYRTAKKAAGVKGACQFTQRAMRSVPTVKSLTK